MSILDHVKLHCPGVKVDEVVGGLIDNTNVTMTRGDVISELLKDEVEKVAEAVKGGNNAPLEYMLCKGITGFFQMENTDLKYLYLKKKGEAVNIVSE